MNLRPYQFKLATSALSLWQDHKVVLIRLDTGGGKCLGKGTPVLLADGRTKLVEDITVGEQLLGPDGSARNVLSLARGREKMYRIVPVKGEPFICNESHILSLVRTRRVAGGDDGQIVNISVREYLTKSERWKHLHKGWRASMVEFPASNIRLHADLPPYLLGLWLGDGDSDGPRFTTADTETEQYLRGYAAGRGFTVSEQPAGGRSKSYGIANNWKAGNLRSILRKKGLLGNKHIPHEYKTASAMERLEILAGLMDTDGHLHHSGYDYISKVRTLAEDVAWVARSVGLAAYVKEAWKSCNGGPKALYWRVSISGDCSHIPCRIPYKKAAPRAQKKDVRRFGFTVEALEEDAYYGFELDGDKLFLLGDFTVTHNTPVLSYICNEIGGFICAVAHRDKLVEQISMTLARAGIKHDLIASDKTKRIIAKKHLKAFKTSFYQPGARCRVASVDTLVKAKGLEKWAAQVRLWIVDEGHHVLKDNKWGRALGLFTHEECRGLLLTATPRRGDGKGLGAHRTGCNGGPCEGCNDGYADIMIEGPPMRWLIDEGYLCDYDVVCPPSVHLDEAPRGKDGDYTENQRAAATADRKIIGDVPKHYLLYARGKSGITFAGNIKDATDIVNAYRAAGVSAELITGNTDPTVRDHIFDRAESGELNQIVAVDVISEGVDIPALLVGSFARLTGSLPLWMQQIGRLLRPIYAPGYDLSTKEGRLAAIATSIKPRALLIDHVGGFANPQLGAPDKPRIWSLDPRDSRAEKDEDDVTTALRVCANPAVLAATGTLCLKPYPRIKRKCPHCGYEPQPVSRGGPEFVEGDLELMSPEALAALQGRSLDLTLTRAEHDAQMIAKRAPSAYLAKFWRQHLEKCQELDELHASMDRWAGQLHARGFADYEIQRAHWLQFGVDVLTPSTLKAAEMRALRERIDAAVIRG